MKLLVLILSLVACTSDVSAVTHAVNSASQFEELMKSGKIKAGDVIVWADGAYRDVELDIEGVDGSEAAPITLRAASPGGVILQGESQFKVGAKWWVVEGLHFAGDPESVNSYNTFQFRSNGGQPAEHVRLTNCAFTDLKTEDETSKWLLLYGQSNIIDHCHFSGKRSKGAMVTVELAYLPADASADHLIRDNYFADFAFQPGTDNETIRIGSSDDQNRHARCVVRRNYFVRCNGENEIVSSKSSYNVFEQNTFRQCNGAVVLRHGHHAHVAGNFFFGDGAKDAGGIRVVDSHHTIVNNYLQDLTGTTWNAAFSILGGKKTSGGSDNGYQAVDQIFVAHNSILNCHRSIFLNKAKGSRGPTGVIVNNLIVSPFTPLISADLPTDNLKWEGNLLHGVGSNAKVEFASVTNDPKLSDSEGLLRPGSDGGAVGVAVPCSISVENDIDGQARPEANADVGADQVSGAVRKIVVKPLTPAEVGVSFFKGEGPRK